MYGNLVFVFVRCWGGAMFFLALGAIPAAFLVPGNWPAEWMVGIWLGLAVPIALYYAWRHWNRQQHNLFAVDAYGIEYLNFPKKLKRIPWNEVRVIRDTHDPDDDDGSGELVFATAQGKFTIGEGWAGGIQAAVGKYFKVTLRESRRKRPA